MSAMAGLTYLNGRDFEVERLVTDLTGSRFTLLAAIGAALSSTPGASGLSDTVAAAAGTLADLPPEMRRRILIDPAFAVWLDQAVLTLRGLPASASEFRAVVTELPNVLARIRARHDDAGIPRIGGTTILVQHDDIDPLVKAATPPSYDFTGADPGSRKGDGGLRAFAEELTTAFANIKACAPRQYEILPQLVSMVGYLPDASFRSCSAMRYRGAIYLAGHEETIIDLEESIVHEAAHQMLYMIGEIIPITTPDASRDSSFELPWSGSMRDLFGYFHAYFVYLQLVKYFDRRAPMAGTLRAELERERELIHRGLVLAGRDIDAASGLSELGRTLFDALRNEVAALGERSALELTA